MAQAKSQPRQTSKERAQKSITAIQIEGYKSIYDETRLEILPLTILAGANSSGKSSIMQPILLMKQTLEANYDPGPLLLNGPNLKFTSAEQLFSMTPSKEGIKRFTVGVEINNGDSIGCVFEKRPTKSIDLVSMVCKSKGEESLLAPGMKHEELIRTLSQTFLDLYNTILRKIINEAEFQDKPKDSQENEKGIAILKVVRNRCFFEIALFDLNSQSRLIAVPIDSPASFFEESIQETIHVPGLRGNPERTYKTTAVSKLFPGTFENYVASVINHWQANQDEKLSKLVKALQEIGLASSIESKQINDTQVELKVGRLPCSIRSMSMKENMVSIADVGFGVSQVLPVLVSLLAAEPGQLVYIEQPEIHLHPRAQVALAEVFAEAVNRGVRVVVETHSELFLQGIQSLVAEEKLSPEKVKLHWFTQQENGATKISSADLDETGAFGDWPEDFAEVSLATQNRYLTAAEAKLWQD